MKNSVKSCLNPVNKAKRLYCYGILFVGIAVMVGLTVGSTRLTPGEIFQGIFSGANSPAARILLYVRLPRTVASLVCGAALSVSGAVIQGVLANRLASPSIIGVNAGAGLAVTLCTAFGIFGGWQLSVFAFLGGFAAVMLVSLCARKWGASRGTVILMGVAMNSLLGALSDTVITLMPNVGVLSNDFKIGEFSAVTYQRVIPAALMIVVTILILLTLSNELDVLTLGRENAKGLGMNPSFMMVVFLLLAALLAGCAVSIAGLLSFVGLIVPHGVRRFAGTEALHVMGLCSLFGGAFVCICDTVARAAFSPYEIPVGIIMAFLGAPFFLYILIKGKGGHARD